MLTVTTTMPSTLLRKIKAAIDGKHVVTWSYDSVGDFTHTPPQWRNRAWFRPIIQGDELKLKILPNVNSPLTNDVYGVYHGRFIEMLLAHFPQDFQGTFAK